MAFSHVCGSAFLVLLLSAHLTTGQATCNALGRLKISVFGGSCSGQAQASCDAVVDSLVTIDNAVNSWLETTPCVEAKAMAAAESIVSVMASVWADALVKIQCTGKHAAAYGCGFALANGKATAFEWTKAIANAIAGAVEGSNFAFCYSDIRALVPVIAIAYADAQADVCVHSHVPGAVHASAFATAFSVSMASAMGRAFANATAFACEGKVDSTCEGFAEAFGPTSSSTDGGVEGGVNHSPGSGGSAGGSTGGSANAPLLQCAGPISGCCNEGRYPCYCPTCLWPVNFLTVKAVDTASGPKFVKVLQYGSSQCTCII